MSRQAKHKSINREAKNLLNSILNNKDDQNEFVNIKNEKFPIYTDSSSNMEEVQIKGIDGNIQKLLGTIIEQNNIIIEANKTIRKENQYIYKYFIEEFITMKKRMEETLKLSNRQYSLNSNLPNLPLKTVEDVLEFETALQTDKEMASDLIAKFDKQSPDEIKKFISNNLKSIFADHSLICKFSWTDVNRNIAVKDFQLIKILKDVSMKNIPQTNVNKVEELIKKFFNSAKDIRAKSLKRKHQ